MARNYNPNPKQPNNAAQKAVTGRFTKVAGFWNGLTDAQREDWAAAAAKEGREGYNLYSSLANVWLSAHSDQGTPSAEPPAGEFGNPGIAITASAASGKIDFHGAGPTATGVVVEFRIQKLARASRKPTTGGYRTAAFAPLSAGDGNGFQIAVAPGAYAASYAFVELASGRRTAFVEIPVSGVALALEQGGAAEKPVSAPKKKAA